MQCCRGVLGVGVLDAATRVTNATHSSLVRHGDGESDTDNAAFAVRWTPKGRRPTHHTHHPVSHITPAVRAHVARVVQRAVLLVVEYLVRLLDLRELRHRRFPRDGLERAELVRVLPERELHEPAQQHTIASGPPRPADSAGTARRPARTRLMSTPWVVRPVSRAPARAWTHAFRTAALPRKRRQRPRHV